MFTHNKITYFIGPIPQTCLLSCYCGIEATVKTGLYECSYSLHNMIYITWRNNFVEVWKDFPRDSGTRVLGVGKPSNSVNRISTSTQVHTHVSNVRLVNCMWVVQHSNECLPSERHISAERDSSNQRNTVLFGLITLTQHVWLHSHSHLFEGRVGGC